MTPFGIKLKHIREQRHKSLKDLSKALKVSIPYVSMLENGKRGRPADGLIELICSYFNLSWEEADELKFLAKHSDINTKMNSEKLSLNATMLTNVLKNNIKWLNEEQLRNLTKDIQDMSKQNQEK
jgi:transcriptional regulator with XRE-family HTH domain